MITRDMKDLKIYSKAVGEACTSHVFDHETGRVICGTNLKGYIKCNKTKYSMSEMYDRHHAISVNRGFPNPYKFCCVKCEKKLEKMLHKSLVT